MSSHDQSEGPVLSIQGEETSLLKGISSGSETLSTLHHNVLAQPTGDDLSHKTNPNNEVYRSVFLVVMPIFWFVLVPPQTAFLTNSKSGYATLFSMQGQVMKAMYGDVDEPLIFSFACSFLYFGNLVFRLGHNIVFGFAIPRTRVIISMGAMVLSMWTIFCIFVWFRSPDYVWLVFVGYGLGGVSIGTFESNVLSMITPLGKDTKLWAIIAIPIGINVVNIGGFILLGSWDWLADNPEAIQLSVMLYCLFGIIVLHISLYSKTGVITSFSIKEFIMAFKDWREWIKVISYNCVAMTFDMFCVSMFSPGVILYIYSGDCIKFTLTNFYMNSFWFVAIYNTFFFLGDTLSRKIFYSVRLINPFLFLLFSAAGIFLGLIDITILVPLTALGVSFANGSLYTQTNRLIDQAIPERFNLVSLSFWLFVGDIGSVVGSNLIPFISNSIKDLYNSPDYSSSYC